MRSGSTSRCSRPGTHVLHAVFTGDDYVHDSVSVPVTVVVTPDYGVAADVINSSSKLYPYKDGYKDTVKTTVMSNEPGIDLVQGPQRRRQDGPLVQPGPGDGLDGQEHGLHMERQVERRQARGQREVPDPSRRHRLIRPQPDEDVRGHGLVEAARLAHGQQLPDEGGPVVVGSVGHLPEGTIVASLAEALERVPEKIEPWLSLPGSRTIRCGAQYGLPARRRLRAGAAGRRGGAAPCAIPFLGRGG